MIEWLTRVAEITFWNALVLEGVGLIAGVLLVAIWKNR